MEEKSIIPFICSDNWLKRCKVCGMYVAHGEVGSVLVSAKTAKKWKAEAFEKFPYMREVNE